MNYENIIDKMAKGYVPSLAELTFVLSVDHDEYLLNTADRVRKQAVGDVVYLRAILEFSNYCVRQCTYCGLNVTNTNTVRYRMEVSDIVKTTIEAYKAGYKTIVLQSGEDPYYTADMICQMVRQIASKTDMIMTLSLGERPKEELLAFKEAGAQKYLLKHECADENIYNALHPCGTLAQRVDCLKNLKQLGFHTGSGFMIGLPNQTYETIAKDLLLLKSIPCDMAGVGPFIPHPDTPLKDASAGSVIITKRAVALTRLLLNKSNLPATTSLGIVEKQAKNDVFSCGANVIMRKVTPWENREYYEIYPTDLGKKNDTKTARVELENMIKAMGKIPE